MLCRAPQTYVTDAELLLLASVSGGLSVSLRTLQLSRLRLGTLSSLQQLPCLPRLTALNFYMCEGSTRRICSTFPAVTSAICRDWPAITDPSLLQVRPV